MPLSVFRLGVHARYPFRPYQRAPDFDEIIWKVAPLPSLSISRKRRPLQAFRMVSAVTVFVVTIPPTRALTQRTSPPGNPLPFWPLHFTGFSWSFPPINPSIICDSFRRPSFHEQKTGTPIQHACDRPIPGRPDWRRNRHRHRPGWNIGDRCAGRPIKSGTSLTSSSDCSAHCLAPVRPSIEADSSSHQQHYMALIQYPHF